VASQLRERTSWKYSHLSVSGVTGITAGQKTLWDRSLHELAVRSVHAVLDRPHGAVGVDFTYGYDSKPYITEIQPARFYSSIEFLAAVGINLPDIYCRLALGLPLPSADERINPIRVPYYWYKAVDMLPKILTQAEVDAIAPIV
jgi:carbamoyl-phosphate synthase large subunit